MSKLLVLLGVFLLSVSVGAAKDIKLMDFESPSKVNRIAKEGSVIYKDAVKVSLNGLWSTSGKNSLCMQFKPFKKGIYQWPGFSCFFKYKDFNRNDWTGFGEFAVDVQNPTAYTVRLCIEIRSTAGKNGNTTVFDIAPDSVSTLKINLEKISEKNSRPVDLKNIQQIILYCTRPPEPWVLNIDNMRLLDNRKQLKCLSSYKYAEMLANYIYDRELKEKYRHELANLNKEIFSQNSVMSAAEITDASRNIAEKVKQHLYEPTFAYNFGPLNSGRLNYWNNAGCCKYSKEKKYGWENTASLKVEEKKFDSNWRKPGNYFVTSRPPEIYLNPEQEGLVASYRKEKFMVELPDGDYRVFMLAGYAGEKRIFPVDMSVDINGEKHRVTLPERYIYKTPVWKTRVKNGILELGFSSNNGNMWLVNAIAVWPEKDHKRAKNEFLNRMHDHINILPENLRSEWIDARCVPMKRKNMELSDYPEEIALFPINALRDYTYDYTPEKYGMKSLSLISAENEIATGVFGVLALSGADEKLNINVSDFKGPEIIPASSVKVNMVVNVPWPEKKDFGPRYKMGRIVRSSRRLENLYEGAFDWDIWQARQIYVMIKPSGSFKPGIYNGKINLRTGKRKAVDLPVTLKVLPITLKSNPEMSYGAYWYWYAGKTESRAREEMQNMRDHGFNMLGPVRMTVTPKLQDGKVVFSMPPEVPQSLLLGREYGFQRPAPYQIEGVLHAICKLLYGKVIFKKQGVGGENLPDSFYPNMTNLVRQVKNWTVKNNLPEVYFYPVDEVYNLDFAKKLLKACREVSGVKTFCNYNPLIQQELGSLIDVSCYPYTMYMNEKALHKLILRTPKRLTWTYSCPGTYGGSRSETRLCWGLSGRKIGLKGFWPWAFCSPQGNPYSAFDGSWVDPMLVYPGLETISTVQYESIRQGIDDARYLYTLKSLIKEALKSNNTARRQAASQAEKELAQAMKEVPYTYHGEDAANWSYGRLEKIREIFAESIIKLQGF